MAALFGGTAIAQDGGGFSAEQAERGVGAFQANCAMCHGAQLQGGDAPALVGADFRANWQTAEGVYNYFSVAMPPFAPGELGEPTYLDILAHILNVNGLPPGESDLDPTALGAIDLVALSQGDQPAAAQDPAAQAPAATAAAADAATEEAAEAPAPAVPQAYTYGMDLPVWDPTSGTIIPPGQQAAGAEDAEEGTEPADTAAAAPATDAAAAPVTAAPANETEPAAEPAAATDTAAEPAAGGAAANP